MSILNRCDLWNTLYAYCLYGRKSGAAVTKVFPLTPYVLLLSISRLVAACAGYIPSKLPLYFMNFWYLSPSSIYSWSISHILEHEFLYLGRLGSPGSKEKVDLSFSENLLRVIFSTFCGEKNLSFLKYCRVCTKMFFFLFFCHLGSLFNLECNLSIAVKNIAQHRTYIK